MNYSQPTIRIGVFLATAALAAAQWEAPPAPPAAPAPAAAPRPQATPPVPPVPARAYAAPAAPAPLAPPVTFLEGQQNYTYVDTDQMRAFIDQAREAGEQGRIAAEQGRLAAEQGRIAAGQAYRYSYNVAPFAAQVTLQGQGQNIYGRGAARNDGTLYGRGLSALDAHHYDQALDNFTEVVSRGGPKADGALYWKAYSLNKLGRRDEATAALAQLRSSYPNSHWLDDAKALDLEVKQASGKPVSPDSESDDDLKLMALNGLSQSDPERTYPLIEKLLKGPASPKLKQKAIFVLAANSSPRAQQLLEQIARGNGNPDLQLTAIRYMVQNKQQPNRSQVLMDIYTSSNDAAVKREILGAFRNSRDYDHLLQIAKSEKTAELRDSAYQELGQKPGNAELWQLYQAETTPEAKIQILQAMYSNGSAEKLTEVARTDKDPKVRLAAIRVLSSYKAANLGETMSSLYASEQDPQVKRAIVNNIAAQRNAKGLVDLFHKESNIELKKEILSRLQNMHTAEANELFLEILK